MVANPPYAQYTHQTQNQADSQVHPGTPPTQVMNVQASPVYPAGSQEIFPPGVTVQSATTSTPVTTQRSEAPPSTTTARAPRSASPQRLSAAPKMESIFIGNVNRSHNSEYVKNIIHKHSHINKDQIVVREFTISAGRSRAFEVSVPQNKLHEVMINIANDDKDLKVELYRSRSTKTHPSKKPGGKNYHQPFRGPTTNQHYRHPNSNGRRYPGMQPINNHQWKHQWIHFQSPAWQHQSSHYY